MDTAKGGKGIKRLVVEASDGAWEVRIPGVHKEVARHLTREEAKQHAIHIVKEAGGGEVELYLCPPWD